MVVLRNNSYKDAISAGIECERFEEYLIIISSLSTLRESLSEEAAQKLLLILEKGSRDYQLTIIIGDTVKTLPAISYEKWYKSKVSSIDGIWVGSGFTEQYILKANKTTPEMRESIPVDFGFSLINGKASQIKLLFNYSEENGDVE